MRVLEVVLGIVYDDVLTNPIRVGLRGSRLADCFSLTAEGTRWCGRRLPQRDNEPHRLIRGTVSHCLCSGLWSHTIIHDLYVCTCSVTWLIEQFR